MPYQWLVRSGNRQEKVLSGNLEGSTYLIQFCQVVRTPGIGLSNAAKETNSHAGRCWPGCLLLGQQRVWPRLVEPRERGPKEILASDLLFNDSFYSLPYWEYSCP